VDLLPECYLFFHSGNIVEAMKTIEGKKEEFTGIDIPSDEMLNNCIHCGLCLPTCPTYAITGLERSSPRGRIRLIKAVAKGAAAISEEFIHEMNFCLDCQACVTACPAGINYGSLVETMRAQIHQGKFDGKFVHYTKKILLNWLFFSHKRLITVANLLRLTQASFIQSLISIGKRLNVLPIKFLGVISLAPKISKKYSTDTLNERLIPIIKPRYQVIFLTGCIMDVAFANVNEDTIQLLLHHGCEVIVPREQQCCGSLQAHNGDMASARKLARHNIELFSKYDFDYIVMNSAGCGAYMKEYGDIFQDDVSIAEKAMSISNRVKDITEFLEETGFFPVDQNSGSPFHNKKVTYHDACHLVHAQRISDQPRKLIKSVVGIKYIELRESTWCCGSAGIYNVTHYEDSMKVLDRKIDNIKEAAPDILVTGNPGCLIQIQHGLTQRGLKVELFHTATFLRIACGV
jgi:glycolate oxidase iron-sulfur subunit